MDNYEEFNVEVFQKMLIHNEGVCVFKFGAEWCNPCKKIEPLFDEFCKNAPSEIKCVKVDVDNAFEIYAQLKRLKMVQGLPTILAYKKGNMSYIADDCTVGSDLNELRLFFGRVSLMTDTIKNY